MIFEEIINYNNYILNFLPQLEEIQAKDIANNHFKKALKCCHSAFFPAEISIVTVMHWSPNIATGLFDKLYLRESFPLRFLLPISVY